MEINQEWLKEFIENCIANMLVDKNTTLKECFEKQKPMNVIKLSDYTVQCPTCQQIYSIDYPDETFKYCGKCGQRIVIDEK